jgi:hypothetical protein
MDKIDEKIKKVTTDGIPYSYKFDYPSLGFLVAVLVVTIIASMWLYKKL